jgi:hypothetical protein
MSRRLGSPARASQGISLGWGGWGDRALAQSPHQDSNLPEQ